MVVASSIDSVPSILSMVVGCIIDMSSLAGQTAFFPFYIGSGKGKKAVWPARLRYEYLSIDHRLDHRYLCG